jgi:hypothetical protein
MTAGWAVACWAFAFGLGADVGGLDFAIDELGYAEVDAISAKRIESLLGHRSHQMTVMIDGSHKRMKATRAHWKGLSIGVSVDVAIAAGAEMPVERGSAIGGQFVAGAEEVVVKNMKEADVGRGEDNHQPASCLSQSLSFFIASRSRKT